jgi:hypothetical protein
VVVSPPAKWERGNVYVQRWPAFLWGSYTAEAWIGGRTMFPVGV